MRKQIKDAVKVLVPAVGTVLMFHGFTDILPEVSGWNAVGIGLAVTLAGAYYLKEGK